MQNVVKASQTNILTDEQLDVLNQALDGLNHEQLSWVSGYVSGLRVDFLSAPAISSAPSVLTILYASQGGNARGVAKSMAVNAENSGFSTRLLSTENYKPRNLLKETYLLIVISTQGEGEPPETAQELFRYLNARKKPELDNLQYAIFGLGDSSYEYFCKAAQDMDKYLQASGAKILLPRVDADVNFQTQAEHWGIETLQELDKVMPLAKVNAASFTNSNVIEMRCDSSNPYRAEVLENRRITSTDSISTTHHIVLEADPATVRYQPGDAVAVFFNNSPDLVSELLQLSNLSGEKKIILSKSELTLSYALTKKLELTLLHPTVIKAWAVISNSGELKTLCKDNNKLRAFANKNQFIDLLQAYPAKVDANTLSNLLLPLKPRLYSIASSQSVYEDEIHITVTTLEYKTFGRNHLGGASGYLTQRINEGDLLDIYIAENSGFRLPADDMPVIMIGAGTGIAPFRAFLQERESRGSTGENWLIFGNRNFHRDFLYQSEWLNYRKDGLLQRASVAFSRDDEERVYVQNRLHQESEDVYAWLQKGAYIYVCGGIEMEKSVMASLVDIAKSHGGMSDDNAEEFINTLHSQGRYLRDVY
jgi:sulfite reductase (NADPH) flavoprotein alpha-component